MPRSYAHAAARALAHPRTFYAGPWLDLSRREIVRAYGTLALAHGAAVAIARDLPVALVALPALVTAGVMLVAAALHAARAKGHGFGAALDWTLFATTLLLPGAILATLLPLKMLTGCALAELALYLLFTGCRYALGFPPARATAVCLVPAGVVTAGVAVTLVVAAVLSTVPGIHVP